MSKSNYVSFSKEEIDRAKRTDLASLLVSMGETVKRSGSEHEWSDNGRKVTIRGCVWFHQYDMTGGDAIDFAQRFFGKTFPEAVVFLNGGSSAQQLHSLPSEKEKKPFALPPKNDTMRRVFGYLCGSRGIDRDVLHTFARHAHKRGSCSQSSFKGNVDSSNPAFSFHWNGISGKIFLFEAPIDMLSFISMHKDNWQQHSYAAACSVSDTVLFQCMKDIGNIDKVLLCMDNDSAGQEADRRIANKLREQGIEYEILVPTMKDWNEDLTSGCGAVQPEPEPEESEEELWMALSL